MGDVGGRADRRVESVRRCGEESIPCHSHGDSDEVFDAIEAGHLVISPASMPLSKKFIPLTKDMLSSNLLLIQHGAYGDQALRDFLSHPKRLGENRRVESSNWRPIEQMLNESQIG